MLRPPTRMSQLWMLSFNEFFAGSKWSGTIQPRWGATSSLRQSGKKAGASQSAVYISSMRVACAAPMVTLVMILPPSPGFAATVPFPRGAVLMDGEDDHGWTAALFAPGAARHCTQEPGRGGADAPIFGRARLSHPLAPDECRTLRRRRRGTGLPRIDQGGAARLRHHRRSRPLA